MLELENGPSTSMHFEIVELAEGVYAALGVTGGAAYSNAAIVDLGEQTLIFDTFYTPRAAGDLRVAAEKLTGRPASYVINSHNHADHWCGNQVFADQATIIATPTIRETMPQSVAWLRRYRENPSELEAGIQGDRERLETETDPRWRATLEASTAMMGHLLESLPTLDFVLPHQTFDGKLVFHGTRRTAELLEVTPGHTASDAYLLLPEDRIALMGDLGFFGCQPFTVFSHPRAWMEQLGEMEGWDVDTFVPGHGPLGTRTDVALQAQYIAVVEELVAKAIKEGLTAEETLEQPLPAPFDVWLHGGMGRWEANVWSTYERLSGEPES